MDLSSYSISAITRRRPLTPSNSYINNTVAVASATVSGSGVRDNLSLQQNQPQQQERENTPQHNNKLHRHLTLTDIIFYGVGCSVGAGIYSLVGIGVSLAGPSIALSFLLCGGSCIFTSLSYAEFAARVPLAGSAYTFTYVSFGELCAWLVGWNLTLGYAVSAAVVARSWADYVMGFVQGFLVDNNDDNTNYNNHSSTQWLTKLRIPMVFGDDYTCCPLSMVIIGFCTLVLVTGVKESSRFQTAMTVLNLSVLGFVLLAGLGTGTVRAENLFPIFPHGIAGMARGAGLVFFAYLGFDMVACLSEEVKNPERNMPIGIIGSLVVSMSIYVSVALVVVGMAPAILLGQDIPVTNALLANACCSPSQQLQQDAVTTCLSYATCDPILLPILFVGSRIISFGAIFGLTTATFSCLMGQPRIFYSMAQDGLLFKIYARVHPRTGVPTIGTILTGIFTALVACFFDLESLANAISLGTLQVFTFVNAGVILLRMRPLTTISDNTTASSPYAKETTPLLGEPKSPIVRDPRAAAVVRSLGLIKKSSRDIRTSLGLRGSYYNVHDNGAKPVWLVVIFTASSILASVGLSNSWYSYNNNNSTWHIIIMIIVVLLLPISAIMLVTLPRSSPPETFACPLVPVIPLLGILCNSYMMGSMPSTTWLVISAWLMAGLLFYGIYGIHHSELRQCVDVRAPAAATSTTASLLEVSKVVVPSVYPLLPPFADFGEKL
ncbi:amino acid/polyamine antiporter [Fragilaria crotonensis]|nr:amino acid/polyamine antiporter [Fragilaria crotonensis]